MGQDSSEVVVKTANAPVEPSPQAKSVATVLATLGYAVSSSGRNVISVADNIDGNKQSIVVLVSEDGKEISINCHVGNLSDIPDDQVSVQRDFFFVCVNMNDVISPFATSLITPEDDATVRENDARITLVNRFNIDSDLADDLAYQMTALRKAVITYNKQTATIFA